MFKKMAKQNLSVKGVLPPGPSRTRFFRKVSVKRQSFAKLTFFRWKRRFLPKNSWVAGGDGCEKRPSAPLFWPLLLVGMSPSYILRTFGWDQWKIRRRCKQGFPIIPSNLSHRNHLATQLDLITTYKATVSVQWQLSLFSWKTPSCAKFDKVHLSVKNLW